MLRSAATDPRSPDYTRQNPGRINPKKRPGSRQSRQAEALDSIGR